MLSLDEEDNSLFTFLTYFVEAIRRLDNSFGERMISLFNQRLSVVSIIKIAR